MKCPGGGIGYTRCLEGAVSERTCGFKSHPGHQEAQEKPILNQFFLYA